MSCITPTRDSLNHEDLEDLKGAHPVFQIPGAC